MSTDGPHPDNLVSPLGSEVTNSLAASGRTRPRRGNRSALFAALTVTLALMSTSMAAHAYQCVTNKVITLSFCQEDACTDGFQVEDVHIPHTMCRTRPVVRDLTDEERVNFRDIIQRLEKDAPNGIYQLLANPSCLRRGWSDAWCLSASTITRLSDASDTHTLAQQKSDWLAKERQAHRATKFRSWFLPIKMGLITLFSLAWPWLLVALKSSLRKYIVHMSVAAILGQVITLLWLEIYRHPWIGGLTVEWPRFALFCEILILYVVAVQFANLIWRKLKPKPQ